MERLEIVFKLSHWQIVTLFMREHLAFQVSLSYILVFVDLEKSEPLSL